MQFGDLASACGSEPEDSTVNGGGLERQQSQQQLFYGMTASQTLVLTLTVWEAGLEEYILVKVMTHPVASPLTLFVNWFFKQLEHSCNCFLSNNINHRILWYLRLHKLCTNIFITRKQSNSAFINFFLCGRNRKPFFLITDNKVDALNWQCGGWGFLSRIQQNICCKTFVAER